MRHQRHISYPVSLGQRLYSILLGPLIVVVILFITLRFFSNTTVGTVEPLYVNDLVMALLFTVGRIVIAYILALIVAVPLAILAVSNSLAEKLLLPLFDILESVPILAFFPILILVFIRFDFLNGAAIFILFLTMLWNIVFTAVGGLKIIPKDISAAAEIFGIKGFAYFRKVLLPAIIPQLVTGSILAVAQAWNLIIVAEVLHTYIPGGTTNQDLFGIGSILVGAAANGQHVLFMAAVLLMVLAIAFLNFFVWQKLLHYAERFKFD